MYNNRFFSTITFLIISLNSYGQFFKKNKEEVKNNETKKEVTIKNFSSRTIESITGKCKKSEGLFTLFQDTVNGNLYLLVKKDQLNKEYIYFSYTEDGVPAVGHFRGNFRDNKTFYIRKYFNKLDFVIPNINFYFDSSSALSKASNANISYSVMASLTIEAGDESKGEYLIKADDLFLTEYFHQVKGTPQPDMKPGSSFTLGNYSRDKTKYSKIRNYPLNTDVVVEYVYDNPSPLKNGDGDVADSRYVSVKLQHSIIEIPANNYKPRLDDPRVGYFLTAVQDMTSLSATPYRDMIHRWNLEKKDKNAAISEPVEPIVYWIENTTPVEFRETIMKAGLTWNKAFEKAGFKDAIQIKIQPDTASWDAGDIRYNVIRWTSSPNPPFGGYGPSFVNPRTGQILGADIMLEYSFLTKHMNQSKLFEAAIGDNGQNNNDPSKHHCGVSELMKHNAMLGITALEMTDFTENQKKEYIESALYYLILHEMGHTLGLNHNMKASQLYSPEELQNKEITQKTGLTGSVMDYPTVNISPNKNKQGQYFTMKPGPYDEWAIEYGYSERLEDEKAETARIQKLLEKSHLPELAFGNDADDMRSPGKAIDPRVMIYDLSNDAISYSTDRIKLINDLYGNIKNKYTNCSNQSHQELRQAYYILTSELNNAATVITRYIGGVYVDRSFIGQCKNSKPYEPVKYEDQKRALKSLDELVFSPDAIKIPNDLYNYLQIQRRGFNISGMNEDPKIHERILSIHQNLLNHLLHPNVLKRITDSELYGNKYSLAEMMTDLTQAVFKKDLTSKVNSFRQNLQLEYLNRLISIAGPEGKSAYDYTSQSQALFQLKTIKKSLEINKGSDPSTIAHRENIIFRIEKSMKN